jgi:hypothetical protein
MLLNGQTQTATCPAVQPLAGSCGLVAYSWNSDGLVDDSGVLEC